MEKYSTGFIKLLIAMEEFGQITNQNTEYFKLLYDCIPKDVLDEYRKSFNRENSDEI